MILVLVLDTALVLLGCKFCIFYYTESSVSYHLFRSFQFFFLNKMIHGMNASNDNSINLEMF